MAVNIQFDANTSVVERGINSIERQMARLTRSTEQVSRAANSIRLDRLNNVRTSGAINNVDRLTQSVQTLERNSTRTSRIIAGLFSAAALSFAGGAVIRNTESYTSMSNSLRALGLTVEETQDRLAQMADIANRTRTPLDSTLRLYTRLNIAAEELGVTSNDIAQFTETIGMSLSAAGIGANESSGALLQLSQAMSAGIVRAEEFNSILEGAYPIARLAAQGIEEAGGSVARLRQMVLDQELTSEMLFAGIMAGSEQARIAFDATAVTISQALTGLRNNTVLFFGAFDQETGLSSILAGMISQVSDFIELLTLGLPAVGDWGRSIAAAFQEIWDNIRFLSMLSAALLETVFSFDVFTDAIEAMKGFFASINFTDIFRGMVASVVSFVDQILQLPASQAVLERVVEAWNRFSLLLAAAIERVSAVIAAIDFRAILRNIFSSIQSGFTIATTLLSAIFASINEVVGDRLRSIIDVVSRFVASVIDWFMSLGTALIWNSIVPDMLADIVEAFVSFGSAALAALTRFGSNVVDFFLSLRERIINSNILAFNLEMEDGAIESVPIVEFFESSEIYGRLRDFARRIYDAFVAGFDTVTDWLTEFFDFDTNTAAVAGTLLAATLVSSFARRIALKAGIVAGSIFLLLPALGSPSMQRAVQGYTSGFIGLIATAFGQSYSSPEWDRMQGVLSEIMVPPLPNESAVQEYFRSLGNLFRTVGATALVSIGDNFLGLTPEAAEGFATNFGGVFGSALAVAAVAAFSARFRGLLFGALVGAFARIPAKNLTLPLAVGTILSIGSLSIDMNSVEAESSSLASKILNALMVGAVGASIVGLFTANPYIRIALGVILAINSIQPEVDPEEAARSLEQAVADAEAMSGIPNIDIEGQLSFDEETLRNINRHLSELSDIVDGIAADDWSEVVLSEEDVSQFLSYINSVQEQLASARTEARSMFDQGLITPGQYNTIVSQFERLSEEIRQNLRSSYQGIGEEIRRSLDIPVPSATPRGTPSRAFATGGYVSGAGGPTSDSIPAMLSNGEYVVNAAATSRFGPILEAINNGTYGSFQSGGLISTMGGGFGSPAPGNVTYTLEIPDPTFSQNVLLEVFSDSDTLVGNTVRRVSDYFQNLRTTVTETVEGMEGSTTESSVLMAEANQAVSESAREAAEAAEDFAERLAEAFAPSDSREFGLSAAQALRDDFNNGLSAFLSGDIGFEDFVHTLLDSFTSQIINSFTQGFTDAIFGENGLNFGNIFQSFFENIHSSFQQTAAESMTGEGGLFRGIGNIFRNLFSGIRALFGGSVIGAATGGYISGAGGPTSDSIPAMLSNGEYVVNAASTRRFRPLLEAMNNGVMPVGFAEGGLADSNQVMTLADRSMPNGDRIEVNLGITGDISRQTKQEVRRMIPEIAAQISAYQRDRNR